MKITIYGGTNNSSYGAEEIASCEDFGMFLAENKYEILTGACGGYPYFVGRGAVRAGGRVIGYTPAKNLEEHTSRYKFPADGVSNMVWAKKEYATKSENFLRRSMDMTQYSDIVVALGGSWGTYSELLFSFFAKKKIIIVDEYGGAGKMFQDTYGFFSARDNNPDVQNGAELVHVRDIAALKRLLKPKSTRHK
jgi:predicted Rossmann-fold nucleotide-binding protein